MAGAKLMHWIEKWQRSLRWWLLGFVVATLCILATPSWAERSKPIAPTLVPSSSKEIGPPLLALSQPDLPEIAIANLPAQGKDLYEAGRFAEAVEVLQKLQQQYRATGATLKQAAVLGNLALAHHQLGNWPEANAAIAASRDLFAPAPQSNSALKVFAEVLTTQGRLQLAQGQIEASLKSWEQAETIYQQLEEIAGISRSQINQAQALQLLGFHRQALSKLSRAQQALRTQPNSLTKVTSLRSIGETLRLVGQIEQSKAVLEDSLELAEQLRSQPAIAAAQLSLGNVARLQFEPEAAIRFYQQAARNGNPTDTRLRSQLNLLSLWIDQGDSTEAAALWPQIRTQLQNHPSSRFAINAQISLAQNLLNLANLNNNSTPQSQNLETISNLLATSVQQAEGLGDRRSYSYALGSLGHLYEREAQLSDAKKLTQQALNVAESINAPDISYRWQWQLGRLFKQSRDRANALNAYESAIETLRSLRSDLVAATDDVQFSFRDSVEPVYRELVSLLLQPETGEPNSAELEQARQTIESLQLAELDNFFQAACLQPRRIQVDRIDREAAVIYPILLPDRLDIILSIAGQPLHRYSTEIPKTEVETNLVQLVRSIGSIQRVNSQRFLPYAQTLYDWIIRPLERELTDSEITTLVFVPDGIMRNVPMATLHDGEQFLLEKYRISVTPGLELADPFPLGRAELRILSAGLSEERQGFPAIPFVEVELDQIQAQLPSEVLLNQAFTEESFQEAIDQFPFPIVHLATHGQFSSTAEDTFILTWDDRISVDELSDLFRVAEVQRTNPVELLVLSACETARGDNRAALGLAGVAVRAGARSTLASLWAVSDEATAELMDRFYEELSNRSVTKAEALRRAQLEILQSPKYNSHPYYWAPFVLVGNWL